MDVFNKIRAKLKAGKEKQPRVNYLVVCLFACHGILKDGMQYVVFNEFDKKAQFYKMMKVEFLLCDFAHKYPNSYIIGIFACCRQLYNHKKMTGCIDGETA